MSIALPQRVSAHRRGLRVAVRRPELPALLALASALNLWGLSINGWANTYYSAAVRSMAGSWHDFLYNAFDPSGVMTVDKPPLALWVQALSVRVFGFHPLSMLVPQALMGVATVWLTYDLVQRRFGRAGGAVAGLTLALTPIAVAVSRHNNPDALLVLCCVAALWFGVRALEDGRTRWVVASGVAVGLGFETKMAVALMVVPALAAALWWVAPRGRWAATRSLLAGGGAMAGVGLAWPVLMWLTPAADRPWISGTSNNSIWSLIWGYNGLGRLDGQAGGPGGAGPGGAGPGGGPGGPGGNLFGGATGPLRLFNEAMGGQVAWLIGFALVAAIALVAGTRLRRSDARTGWLIATAGSFATIYIAFSAAKGIFHPYYVSLLAPFVAALVGAGAAQVLSGDTVARALAPLMLAAGVLSELLVLHRDATELTWAGPLVLVVGGLAAVALAYTEGRARRIVLAAGIAALLAAPATWAAQTVGHATNGTFPAGGPVAQGPGGGGAFGGPGGGGPFGSGVSSTVTSYVRAHGGGSIAVSSQQGASGNVIDGLDVVALGGFSGRESEVSASWLAQAVAGSRVRWVVTDGGGLPFDSRTGSRSIMQTVQSTCAKTSVSGLYDCAGRSAAIASAG